MKRSRAAGLIAAGFVAPSVSARAQGTAPYKIGVTWPLTGPFAPSGAEFLKGPQLAVEDVNAAGGIKGRPIQLAIEDSQGSPQAGVAAYRKLVQVDGVQCIQSIFTNVVTAQIPLADDLKIPTMGSMEAPGLFNNREFSFSHAPTWDKNLPLMVNYWKANGTKRIYGLLANSSLGAIQSPALKAKVAELGGEYAESLLDPNQTDFRGVLERVRAANPQVVMLTGQGSTTEANAIKQMRELGINAQVWAFSNVYTVKSFRDAVGPYSEGLVFAGINLDPNNPISNPFVRKYRSALGFIPAYPAGECYDIIRMFAYAIGKGGYNAEAIRNVIANLKGEVTSVLGNKIMMGSDHYSVFSNAALWRVKAGKLVKLG
jgi:branched-chain amino acid transport system substrate-binding protein